MATFTIAYSYLRYSTPQQSEGDSIRRQTVAAQDWCDRNSVPLDTGTVYEDRGRSGYKGDHRKHNGALARFLADVSARRIPKGAVLVIENLDRLSREPPSVAVGLLCNIINAGVAVMALSPREILCQKESDLMPLMLALMEFGRGHSESASKADRATAWWAERKRRAREQGEVVTRRLPAWVEKRDGKLVLIPARARVIRQIFNLAVKGYGEFLIVKKLTKDRVAHFGRGNGWSRAYVHKILTGRAVLGEYQPMTAKKPDGEPIPDYYPRVVDEETWHQAQAALARRKSRSGRAGHKVASLFQGLLHDARTRSRLQIAWRPQGRGEKLSQVRALVSADSMEGKASIVSFPYPIFEAAVLSCLKEINPADVVGEEPESELVGLMAELASVQQRGRQVAAELIDGQDDVRVLADAARALSDKEADLQRRLAIARQKESKPAAVAWAETQTLIEVARDEATRLRLRGLLQTIVQEAWVLVVAKFPHRLAAVQIYFTGGVRRDYLIHYLAAGHGRKGRWSVRSFSEPLDPSNLDLRNAEHAERLHDVLSALDLTTLDR
jgi:DNA invertase Pin-like site-specific DNA recombinase